MEDQIQTYLSSKVPDYELHWLHLSFGLCRIPELDNVDADCGPGHLVLATESPQQRALPAVRLTHQE